MRILHYINQFFAGFGGEEQADARLEVLEGPVGPGRLLAQRLPGAEITTAICGDNYAAEHLGEITADMLRVVEQVRAQAVVLGPAFNAGRYGLVCGQLAAELPARAGVPAITGLYEENAALNIYRARALIVRTGKSAVTMPAAMETIARLLPRLMRGERIEARAAEGLYDVGARKTRLGERLAADRAVDMLLDLLAGGEVATELVVPEAEQVPPPRPVADSARATIALVTEGGLVPRGNPDRLKSGWSERWTAYAVADLLAHPEAFESIHGGYNTEHVNRSPFRLVPADVVAELVAEGRVGALHSHYYVTAGMATPVKNARAMGAQIAEVLRRHGVDAVILTST